MTDSSKIKLALSPHREPRPAGVIIDTIVLHSTVLDSLEEVVAHFASPASKVSSHYTVGRDGRVIQHVPEEEKAWHAGASRMPDGRERVNDFSIGIELVNRNDGIDPYSAEQYSSLSRLIEAIAKRHPIKHLVGHVEIATPPGRKCDPKGFDYDKLTARVKALRPPRRG